MRTDLDHLPPQKQRELERVVQLIFEEFDGAFALAKHEWKKAGRILKVILYGSYARGTSLTKFVDVAPYLCLRPILINRTRNLGSGTSFHRHRSRGAWWGSAYHSGNLRIRVTWQSVTVEAPM